MRGRNDHGHAERDEQRRGQEPRSISHRGKPAQDGEEVVDVVGRRTAVLRMPARR
jgi:hypothetical protein